MKAYLVVLIFLTSSFYSHAVKPSYKSEIFRTYSASTTMVICLYLGHEFSFAEDTLILFNKMMDKFEISQDLRNDIMEDAKNYWTHNQTLFDMDAETPQKQYWDRKCEDSTNKMRLHFTDTGSANDT